jgi:hypothetical protein
MKSKRITIISEAGPPIGDTVAEGGSLRAWGLAKSLSDLGHKVTFLYRKGYEKRVDSQAVKSEKKVKVSTWDPAAKANQEIESADVVIVRQSHGEAIEIVDELNNDQILVVDCYVPINVEVSARDSEDKEKEYKNFVVDDCRWTNILARGDYFLYASENQKLYLLGLLSGILLLNPLTYREIEKRLIKIPYCFFAKDSKNRIDSNIENPSLLWYGGLYAWFDIGSIVPGLLEIKKAHPKFKFILAGAKNPYVSDESLVEAYNRSIKKLEPIKDFMIEVPHQEYSKRFETYSKCSAIVYINKDGLENSLAWRTRLVDYILAKKPIITNGGDPLGEDLISEGVALTIDVGDKKSLLKQFNKALELNIDRPHAKLVKKYSWESNIKKLSGAIDISARLINDEENKVLQNIKISTANYSLRKKNILRDAFHYYKDNGFQGFTRRLLRPVLKLNKK